MLVVAVLALRAVKGVFRARKFAGELVGCEVLDRLHGSTAEWTPPTGVGTCCFGSRSRPLETSRNKQLAATRYARLTITVG